MSTHSGGGRPVDGISVRDDLHGLVATVARSRVLVLLRHRHHLVAYGQRHLHRVADRCVQKLHQAARKQSSARDLDHAPTRHVDLVSRFERPPRPGLDQPQGVLRGGLLGVGLPGDRLPGSGRTPRGRAVRTHCEHAAVG